MPAGSPFRHATFRNLWIANLGSNIGGMIHTVGAAWLMASMTTSPALVALVQASVTLPIMLLSMMTGAIADNVDRRLMMILAQSFMLIVSILLTICAAAGLLTPWLLLTFTFLIGCGAATNTPAWQASVGDVVPRRDLSAAIGLNSVGFNLARSLGPALGGIIVAAAGAATAFALNTASYLGLIFALSRWKLQRSATLPREKLTMAIAGGLRFVAQSPPILALLGRSALFGAATSAVSALLPVIARDQLMGGAMTYGFLLGSFGLGAVGGAFFGVRLRRRFATEWVVRGASLAWIASAALIAVSRFAPLTMAALLVNGASFLLAMSTFNVTVQLSTPRWVVARALSLYQMCAFGSMALGSWAWGELATHHSIAAALLAGIGLQLLCILFGLRSGLADPQGLNLDPLRPWRELETALPVNPNSGPITVTIDYRIAPRDADVFLLAMNEWRRIRRRDGALSWALLRDLSDPELWTERFQCATWFDYLRHLTRLTQADSDLQQSVRAFHQGPDPPRVRRSIEQQLSSATQGEQAARPIADPFEGA